MNETLVAILDNDTLVVLFEDAHMMRVSVKQAKRVTKFQVEDGTERSDHVVQEAREISIDFLLTDDTRNGFQQIQQAWQDNRLVAVQTKVDLHENMLIADIPYDNTPDIGDAISVQIRLAEWRPITPEYGDLPPRKVSDKKQSGTVKRGSQQTTESSEDRKKKGSVLGGWGRGE